MSEVSGWQGTAFNQATESENRIHSDEVARRYGFRGGLVPGVNAYAYLVHPAVVAWGLDWLARGTADVVLRRPLYEGDPFRVEAKSDGSRAYLGEVIDPEGAVCAAGRVAIPDDPAPPALRRGDPPAGPRDARPDVSRAALEKLRERGMGALHLEWDGKGDTDRYLRDLDGMPDLVRPDLEGFAHPAFTLGMANWILDANVRLDAWIHAQSDVRNHAAVPFGSRLVVEAHVVDLFERGGHEFVDLDVTAFIEPDQPVLSARHRAIYHLRETGS
jgi:hypothetical protein